MSEPTPGVPPTPSITSACDDEIARVYLQGRDVACPGCGYNRRDGTAAACPECTRPLEIGADLGSSRAYTIACRGLGIAGAFVVLGPLVNALFMIAQGVANGVASVVWATPMRVMFWINVAMAVVALPPCVILATRQRVHRRIPTKVFVFTAVLVSLVEANEVIRTLYWKTQGWW